jgi:bidirectional [NiFe] hydrogenase diaphorase subunit
MAALTVTIDGKEVFAEKGATLLDAARSAGIDIPTLCHHEALKPYGGCRLCLVELKQGKRSSLVASCGYFVKQGLTVETDSPRVRRARKLILELLLAMMEDDPKIRRYARDYGVGKPRYDRSLTHCINCGLCVRYCDEVKKANCIGFVGRGVDREVAWIPLDSYKKTCEQCLECKDLCPTGVFPSNWGVAERKIGDKNG